MKDRKSDSFNISVNIPNSTIREFFKGLSMVQYYKNKNCLDTNNPELYPKTRSNPAKFYDDDNNEKLENIIFCTNVENTESINKNIILNEILRHNLDNQNVHVRESVEKKPVHEPVHEPFLNKISTGISDLANKYLDKNKKTQILDFITDFIKNENFLDSSTTDDSSKNNIECEQFSENCSNLFTDNTFIDSAEEKLQRPINENEKNGDFQNLISPIKSIGEKILTSNLDNLSQKLNTKVCNLDFIDDLLTSLNDPNDLVDEKLPNEPSSDESEIKKNISHTSSNSENIKNNVCTNSSDKDGEPKNSTTNIVDILKKLDFEISSPEGHIKFNGPKFTKNFLNKIEGSIGLDEKEQSKIFNVMSNIFSNTIDHADTNPDLDDNNKKFVATNINDILNDLDLV